MGGVKVQYNRNVFATSVHHHHSHFNTKPFIAQSGTDMQFAFHNKSNRHRKSPKPFLVPKASLVYYKTKSKDDLKVKTFK